MRQKIPVDVVGIILVIALVSTGVLTVQEGFAGFGDNVIIIIGGLGSVTGCFIGAILVALVANYAGFLLPKLALVSDIMLMVAVLLWRPRGLFPVTSR